MNNKSIKNNRKNTRGSVSVEMALLMIPLIVMTFGVAEFGRAIYQYNTLTKVVRDSVRVVSQHDPSDVVNYPLFEAEARCLAVHGTIDCSGPALLPGLTTGMMQIISAPDPGTGINMVTVTISGYVFNFIFNPLVFFGNTGTNIPFGDVHSTMRQQ
tara:strand:- start:765 stop:1232 length:468 start_codon:yes stop_codon:yes gene_type:complete